ncbi:thioredoxin family protein [Paludisphaera rhizosphaerae]|uniref:thioredoxin family protein n=1 Tax=Paludisphaera rhizosphaerae TaxID=2711216 RepID=UPI0013EB5144|nr:thioredoxin family protein [Paludisphaera rhizosphaerae]
MRSVTMFAALCGGLVLVGAARGEEAKPAKKSIYDATADARAQVEKAAAQAKKDGTRVLLMFGGDWCGWCHKLHTLFREDKEIATILSNEYELVMIDTKAPNAETYLSEASKGLDGVGYPFLAVYDADGKLLKGQKTDPLEEGDHHDPAKVKAFLEEWKVAAKDADAVVSEALAKASSEGKRVFLRFGAPWCGWCHKLDDYLARPEVAKAFADDFVLVKVDVDRMTRGQDVMKKYRPEATSGIPWFVVLDGQGKAHGTADASFGNIGYPFEPKEIDAFVKLMESQGTLDRGQLETLRKNLESAADEIRSQQAKRKAAG